MEGIVQGARGAAGSGSAVTAPASNEDRIVVVRPAVVEHVGHVFGNLFQRIYHLTNEARERDADTAALLNDSIRQLEDFLQLVMDYFSPLPLALQHVPAIEVAQSLAREISDAVGRPVRIDGRHASGRLLVDPGSLVRAFALLAGQLQRGRGDHKPLVLHTAERSGARSMALSVCVPPELLSTRSARTEMQWSVAEKVLESHGGALTHGAAASGEVSWEIVLPLQS